MTIWFTADLHLGHANIIEYCKRPFTDTAAMADALVGYWNAVVVDEDVVYVIGDVAMGRIDDTLGEIHRLRGQKILVAGNHDRCWNGHGSRANGWTQRYLDAGFDTIVQGSTTLRIGRTVVRLCHFPYVGDSGDHDRYVEHRPPDRGEWLLHGHVHEKWAQRGRMINVGVDVTGYRPIGESEIEVIVRNGPTDRAQHERP